jgi:hypothetical protein
MKKYFMIFAATTLVGVFSITSCGNNSKWTEKDKMEFLETCVSEASVNTAIDAETYCDCMLEKIMVKYPDPKDSDKVTMLEVMEWAEDCLAK